MSIIYCCVYAIFKGLIHYIYKKIFYTKLFSRYNFVNKKPLVQTAKKFILTIYVSFKAAYNTIYLVYDNLSLFEILS